MTLDLIPALAFALLGLIIGSFLNVVIARLPPWLEHQWQREACEWLGQPGPEGRVPTLMYPASHCPHCRHPLKWWHNLPVLSFLMLRGRCAFCASPIAWQYPTVELLNALWWGFCWLHAQGDWTQALWWSTWGSMLLSMAWIDAKTMLLPDVLTLTLLWAALVWAAWSGGPSDAATAVWGAVLGYGLLWLPARLYAWLTGKTGMANGDFKLLAAIGASLGPIALPVVLLTASLLSLGFALCAHGLARGRTSSELRDTAIPFGPALAAAAILQHSLGGRIGLEWL